jgi:hypothetical protein
MHRTILTAASVVALTLGTAMAQTSTSPNATGGAPSTLDRSMDCDSGSPTAKAPGTGGSAGSTTSRDSAGTAGSDTSSSGASSNSRTAMTDCGPKSGSTLPPGSKSPSAPSPSGTPR